MYLRLYAWQDIFSHMPKKCVPSPAANTKYIIIHITINNMQFIAPRVPSRRYTAINASIAHKNTAHYTSDAAARKQNCLNLDLPATRRCLLQPFHGCRQLDRETKPHREKSFTHMELINEAEIIHTQQAETYENNTAYEKTHSRISSGMKLCIVHCIYCRRFFPTLPAIRNRIRSEFLQLVYGPVPPPLRLTMGARMGKHGANLTETVKMLYLAECAG
jgi:hypothetical protein